MNFQFNAVILCQQEFFRRLWSLSIKTTFVEIHSLKFHSPALKIVRRRCKNCTNFVVFCLRSFLSSILCIIENTELTQKFYGTFKGCAKEYEKLTSCHSNHSSAHKLKWILESDFYTNDSRWYLLFFLPSLSAVIPFSSVEYFHNLLIFKI
jgi:hypothetical protein